MPPVPPLPVNYSNLGDVRFGRFFWVLALFLISSQAHVRAAQSVRLAWNASPSSGVTGYRVHYRTSSGSQSTSVNVGNVLTATISSLEDATTYVFWVTAYNSAGLESSPSNEISYTTPASPPETYSLTVNNGTGDGAYPSGSEVTVTADPPQAGERFQVWEGDIAILDDFTSESTQALIPFQDVTITATYTALPTFNVVVTNGTGDGSYYAGAQVNITANPAPAGQQFSGWTGNVTFSNASSPTTSFTMPSTPVVVTATYSVSTGGGTGTGLRGEYYNNPSNSAYPLEDPFSGSPVLTRTDGVVNFSWAQNSPASQVSSDNFSVKWTGQVRAPVSGSYTFTVTGDDGVRLFLNGQLVIDGWTDQYPTSYSYTTTLTAGTLYDIEVHYYEHSGDATCRLRWSYPGQPLQTIPQSQLYPTSSVAAGSGLRGEYFNDSSADNYPLNNPFAAAPVLTRTDSTVDFDWNYGSPAPQVNSSFFSARWTGRVRAPVTGTYTFYVTGDDGVRLLLNGNTVIDGWRDQGATSYSYTTNLTAGTLYDIELDYYEHEGRAVCELQWSYPGQSTEVIPSSQLYSSTGP